jgi:hypothetical protein
MSYAETVQLAILHFVADALSLWLRALDSLRFYWAAFVTAVFFMTHYELSKQGCAIKPLSWQLRGGDIRVGRFAAIDNSVLVFAMHWKGANPVTIEDLVACANWCHRNYMHGEPKYMYGDTVDAFTDERPLHCRVRIYLPSGDFEFINVSLFLGHTTYKAVFGSAVGSGIKKYPFGAVDIETMIKSVVTADILKREATDVSR